MCDEKRSLYCGKLDGVAQLDNKSHTCFSKYSSLPVPNSTFQKF